MNEKYVIYCDESVKNGKRFSNFYGGLIIKRKDLHEIVNILENFRVLEGGYKGEYKWQNIKPQNLQSYLRLINIAFDLIKNNKIRFRVLFTNNFFEYRPDDYSREHGFFLLYYQFLKHIFGLSLNERNNTSIRIDKLPDKKEKVAMFINWISTKEQGLRYKDITEVDSAQDDIMQIVDIILGSIQFKLNKQNEVKQVITSKKGTLVKKTGKRTGAKIQSWNLIKARIQDLPPETQYRFFTFGQTTGEAHSLNRIRNDLYRHWMFQAYDAKFVGKVTVESDSPTLTT